jgi:hypothetical protein
MSEGKKTRITLDLLPKATKRLTDLQALIEAESKAQVIRQALQLYEFAIKKHAKGKRFFVGNDKESAAEIPLFI